MKFILDIHNKIKPLFEKGGKLEKLEPLFEAHDSFVFTPGDITKKGSHIRDSVDLKRVMSFVILALIPCLIFSIWNTGHQYNIANMSTPNAPFPNSLMFDMIRGLIIVGPIILVSYLVGGFWEVLFACVRKHEINEGFLVTGLIFPLTLPPSIPLWMVAVGVSFGVVIGKEIFGGTGMNVLNPALTGRVFLFFAYPVKMAGEVWTNIGNGNFVIDWFTNRVPPIAVESFSGATPLAILGNIPNKLESAESILASNGFTFSNMFLGFGGGSLGETSTLACLLGAIILLVSGIASWRIMLSAVIGILCGGYIANIIGESPASQLPPYYHLVMGGFAFGAIFMATDPVSAAATKVGKLIYGFLIGLIVIIVRVAGGYPEGVMLSILFMNAMAPMIDQFIVQGHIKRRTKNV